MGTDTYLFFRKYKSVTVFFVQSVPGLTMSLKGFVVCVYSFIEKPYFRVLRWNFNHEFSTSVTTCAPALHTSTPLIHKYKHRHATLQVFRTNAEFSPRFRDIFQVFQTFCRGVF